MRYIILYIVLIGCLLISKATNAQFLGGDGDGYESAYLQTPLNQQNSYCSGGDNDGYSNGSVLTSNNQQDFYCQGGNSDGYDSDASVPIIFIEQEFYCSGGNGDGYSSDSILSTNNQQDFYCRGGNGDGHSFGDTIPIIFIDQEFYCSGGNGDGNSSDSVFSTNNQQDFYCQGGDGDGHSFGDTIPTIFIDQEFYCSGGNGDGNSSDSVFSTNNQQDFYCQGGDGDGHSFGDTIPIIFIDQEFYCSGGNGDGNSFDSVFSTNNQQDFYCQGGVGDGSNYGDTIPKIFIDQDFYCSGGEGDGYSAGSKLSPFYDQSYYCQGGEYDGAAYGASPPTIQIDQTFYCSGGDSDGYNSASILSPFFDQSYYCQGGNQDGYAMTSFGPSAIIDASFYCSGGNNDGYASGYFNAGALGIGIWTGLVNTAWNLAGNWKHDIVPGITNDVIIPDACPRYPILTLSLGVDTTRGIFKCKSINVLDGATITSNNYLYVNGEMTISGSYDVVYNKNYLVQVFKHGNITLNPTGYMHLGAPSGGRSLSDLRINSGGVLNIEGGTLEIDDQLFVLPGGELNMSSGEIFAGKYGLGTPYAGYAPAVFYVQAGALGGITGGNLKVCGTTPVLTYAGGVIINEPGFHISDSATLIFMNGDLGTHYNTGLFTVDGVKIQNLIINKPLNTIFVRSNLHLIEDIIIEENAILEIEVGHTITNGP